MNELIKLIKQAHETPKPSLLNRIRAISEKLGVSRQELALLCQNAVESEGLPHMWKPCKYNEKSARIPCALARI